MIHGLYHSAQGAQIQSLRQDIISNNLANASTNAFKRDLLRVQAHVPYDVARHLSHAISPPADALPGGVSPADTVTNFAPGRLIPTEGTLDVALTTAGFFRVSDGQQSYLTRDGQFSLNARGQLVTREQGLVVLGDNGQPITGIDSARPLEIREDGTLLQGADEIGRLALVEPESYAALQKFGHNLFTTTARLDDAPAQVRQGYLEASGTNPVTEMMELIEAARAFEANINMIKTQDDALGRLLGGMARR